MTAAAPAPAPAAAPVQVVDAALARATDPAQRRPIDVAVGILRRADGWFLMTSRPAGKPYAGYWEFPGGKFESGEDAAAALRRELAEELGLHITTVVPWRVQLVDYPHALVRLHFCQVWAWAGAPQPLEAQAISWQRLPVQVAPVLPGSRPVLVWLAEDAAAAPPAP